jgi:hypothetical protein
LGGFEFTRPGSTALVYFMTWRNLKVRYKQSLLGIGWAILQPFLTMVVFSSLFRQLGLAFPRMACLTHLFLYRPDSLDVVFQGAAGCQPLAGAEQPHDHQGVFPAHDPADGSTYWRAWWIF